MAPPFLSTKPDISWANVVNFEKSFDGFEIPLHLHKNHFDKLKNWSSSSVTIEPNLWYFARDSMQTSFYAKFLYKAFPLD